MNMKNLLIQLWIYLNGIDFNKIELRDVTKYFQKVLRRY